MKSAAGSAEKYVVFLRGINVGKAKRIAMADLRELLSELGYREVATLLQSGNGVFVAKPTEPQVLERDIRSAIAKRFGLDVAVIARTAKDLAAVVENNPFSEHVNDGAKLHVSFLSEKPAPRALRGIAPTDFLPEQFVVARREIYLWLAHGVRESKLLTALGDRRLGVATTARNWNTLTKLTALAHV